jgi:asparagine synthase (glutamine-hydrolysing)
VCGILGYYSLGRKPVDRSADEVVRLRDMMSLRGPDASGYREAADRHWILAHRRLSIIDLSPLGHQPMSDPSGRYHVCYNGEIYNYRTLRKELEALGHTFKSQSDTEVLLLLYRQYGVESFRRVSGMFAAIFIDEEKQQAVIVRDPAGEKPLFYALIDGVVVMASDPGVISKDRGYRKAVNPQGLYFSLTMGGVKSPDTLFEGIYKLEPGCYRVIDTSFAADRPGTRYFEYKIQPWAQLRGNGDSVERLDHLLDRAVEARMISDVPFGVYLSGGIDSALILSYMSQYTDPVNTFSVDLVSSPNARKEVSVAEEIARQFKTNHHSLLMTEEQYIEMLDSVLFRGSILTMPDSALIAGLSRLARANNVTVIETGEGADEIFMGYDGHLAALSRVYRRLKLGRGWVPPAFARALCAFGSNAGAGRVEYLLDNIEMRAYRLVMADYLYQPFLSYQAERLVRRQSKRPIRAIKAQVKNDAFMAMPDYRRYAPSTMSFYWSSHYRWGDFLLDRIDRHTMSSSVEGRAPFLDTDVVNFGLSLSDDLKVRNGQGKYILRKIAEKRVSIDHAALPKRGFGGGNDNMLSFKICSFMRSKLAASPSYRETPMLKMTEILTRSQLFTLTSFYAWMDLWML